MSKNSKRSVHSTCIEYKVSYHKEHHGISPSLIDWGANGGVAGNDVRVIFKTNRNVDIQGIDNHRCTNIEIATVGGVTQTHKGPVIGIFHQYALFNKGSSIHSPCQFEWYRNDVNDKSVLVPGGLQRIQTLDGYIIPLSIQDGLTRLKIRPYTDQEFDTLPHVIMRSELEWDPSVLNHEFKEDEQWGDPSTIASSFNEVGEYNHHVALQHHSYFQCQDGNSTDDVIDQCIFVTHSSPSTYEFDNTLFYDTYEMGILDAPTSSQTLTSKHTIKREPHFQKVWPLFGWLSTDLIQKTFEYMTQYARLPTATMLKKAFRSPNPALNIYWRNEVVACDIVYSDVPAIFDGSTAAVIFIGTSTKVADEHGIKKDNQLSNLQTHLKTILFKEVLPIIFSVIEVKLLLVTRLKISFVPFVLTAGKVNPTSITRTPQNDDTRP
jgi:hypothetical protein